MVAERAIFNAVRSIYIHTRHQSCTHFAQGIRRIWCDCKEHRPVTQAQPPFQSLWPEADSLYQHTVLVLWFHFVFEASGRAVLRRIRHEHARHTLSEREGKCGEAIIEEQNPKKS